MTSSEGQEKNSENQDKIMISFENKEAEDNYKFSEFKYNFLQKMMTYRKIVDAGVSLSKSITAFAQSKSALSFVEGGVSLINFGFNQISGYSADLFTIKNGWQLLAGAYTQKSLYDILTYCLNGFPRRKLRFSNEAKDTSIFETMAGDIVRNENGIYFKKYKNTKSEVIKCILKEKFKDKKFKMLSLVETKLSNEWNAPTKFELRGEENIAIPSETSKNLSDYIKKYTDNGVSRSIILNGPPGTGKTTLAYSVVQDLDFNTLKFRYSTTAGGNVLSLIPYLLEIFDIQAILLDDFDYFGETNSLLEFLEYIHRHTKVVIAITNSYKGFAPAILRPGRFDEIKTLEHLDDGVLRKVLGEFYDELAPRVKDWPIAYINELIIRRKADKDMNMEAHIRELAIRVEEQVSSIGGAAWLKRKEDLLAA